MRRAGKELGSVLVLALLVIATLTGVTVAFSGVARTEVSLSAFSRDAFRAEALARSALQNALWVLSVDEDLEVDSLDEDWNRVEEWEIPVEVPEEARVTVRVMDEGGKLNVNALRTESGEIDEERAEQAARLLEVIGLDPAACDALLDWLDADDIKRMDGAESYYYEGLETPYACGNGPFLSVNQLRLVKGLERIEGLGEEGDKDLGACVTVYSDGKVNVNTAPAEVLMSLDRELSLSVAESILSIREEEPFQSVDALKNVPGMEEALFGRIEEYLTVKSPYFGLFCEGHWGEAVCRIEAVAHRGDQGVTLVYWRLV